MSLDAQRRGAFREIFARISETAAMRERERKLPYDEIRELVDAGFTALRVPVEHGGDGVTLIELFDLLIELAEADSNLPQALRGHLGFVERLLIGSSDRDEEWLRRISAGATVGNAQAEAGGATTIGATIERNRSGWELNGRKYYTTGTLFSDFTWATVADGDALLSVVVATDADGTTVHDDWDGLGQRLTGSGTTHFENVQISDDQVFSPDEDPPWLIIDVRLLFHLLLQATMVGIGQAALKETIRVVRERTRSFGVPGKALPREDPRVHVVLGELSSRVAGARAIVRDVAADYEAVRKREHPSDEDRVADYVRLQIRQFEAQQIVVTDILRVTTELYEVGGASLVTADAGLDRHWRNARTIASHNPAIFRKAAIGDWLLNETVPERDFR